MIGETLGYWVTRIMCINEVSFQFNSGVCYREVVCYRKCPLMKAHCTHVQMTTLQVFSFHTIAVHHE